ncbi:hypothetical protein JXD38_04900 [candidate division WOR-3 bacterium]|nr:hypothetical protein [candidate division WOR-3 bacterium]
MGTSPPKPVVELVERFSRDRKAFLSPEYKEEQLRHEFLNRPRLRIHRSALSVHTLPDIQEEPIKACPLVKFSA